MQVTVTVSLVHKCFTIERINMAPHPRVRLQQFPGIFWVEAGGNKLLCKFCHNRPVDHTRVKSVNTHINSANHRENVRRAEQRPGPVQLQPTLNFTAQQSRSEVVDDWTAAIAEADIPFYRAEKLLPFLRKHLKYGGSVPHEGAIRTRHLPKVYEEHIAAVRALLRGKKVAVVVDETTDARDKSVLNVVIGKL